MKMSRKIGLATLGIMLFFAAKSSPAADAPALFATVSADYFGRYIYRGQNVNDKSVLQPSVAGSAYGLTGSVWANIDLTNRSQTAPNNAGVMAVKPPFIKARSRWRRMVRVAVSSVGFTIEYLS